MQKTAPPSIHQPPCPHPPIQRAAADARKAMIQRGTADAGEEAATWRPGMDSAPEPPDGTFWRYAIARKEKTALKKSEERKREVTVTLFEKRGHTRGIFLSGNG